MINILEFQFLCDVIFVNVPLGLHKFWLVRINGKNQHDEVPEEDSSPTAKKSSAVSFLLKNL